MLRRCVSAVVGIKRNAVRLLSTSKVHLDSHDFVEMEREAQLRQEVSQKYRGANLTSPTSHEYGNFSVGSASSHSFLKNMEAPKFSAQGPSGGSRNVNWLMLFTGAALAFLSAKLMWQQATRGVSNFDVPLWLASVELQAKHLLFSLQFDHATREHLKGEFQDVRRQAPFADFFEWVRLKHPEYGCGYRYSIETSIASLVSVLRNGDSRVRLLFARAYQQSLTATGADARTKVDNLIDKTISLIPSAAPTPLPLTMSAQAPNAEGQHLGYHVSNGDALWASENSTAPLQNELDSALSIHSNGPHSSLPFQYSSMPDK